MAAKQPQKRPTEAQLTKSIKRIGGYVTARFGDSFKEIANDLGTTERALRNYLFGDQAKTLRNFPRTKSSRTLFNISTNITTRTEVEKFGERIIRGRKVPQTRMVERKVRSLSGPVLGVNPYEKGSGSEEQERYYQRITQSIKLQAEVPALQMTLGWQKYTATHNLPTSIEEIKELYADGVISKRQVSSILTHWHSIYSNMSDDWYEDMQDQFAEYDEFAE